MEWEVEFTNEFDDWFQRLAAFEQDAVAAAVVALGSHGPALGRPLVETIKQSRHANMKELRPPSGNLRVLFAFDPRRAAILLLGGDKTNRWRSWYEDAIPRADHLYDEYLDELRREGLIE